MCFPCFRYQNTIGAAFGCRRVRFPTDEEERRLLGGGRRELVLGVWDTAGSERYQSMSRIYYRGASAAVVCYDVTDADSWERLGFWVAELRRFEERCRVYLCATKADLVDARGGRRAAVDPHDAADYAEEEGCVGPIETSSKTGQNVEELFLRIARDYLEDPRNRAALERDVGGVGSAAGSQRGSVVLPRSRAGKGSGKRAARSRSSCCSS